MDSRQKGNTKGISKVIPDNKVKRSINWKSPFLNNQLKGFLENKDKTPLRKKEKHPDISSNEKSDIKASQNNINQDYIGEKRINDLNGRNKNSFLNSDEEYDDVNNITLSNEIDHSRLVETLSNNEIKITVSQKLPHSLNGEGNIDPIPFNQNEDFISNKKYRKEFIKANCIEKIQNRKCKQTYDVNEQKDTSLISFPDDSDIHQTEFHQDSLFICDNLKDQGIKVADLEYSHFEIGLNSKEIDQNDFIKEKKWIPNSEQLKAITLLLKYQYETRSASLDIAINVVKTLNNIFKIHKPNVHVDLYGSFCSQTAITTSNINLMIQTQEHVSHSFMSGMHKTLSRYLPNYQITYEEKPNVKHSKIYLTEPQNGIVCEIAYLGKKNFLYISHLLKIIINYDERIKILLMLIKIWTEYCELHEVENGYLHSIGYTLMMIHFLQNHEPPILPIIDVQSNIYKLLQTYPKSDFKQTLGELWLEFFRYYSCIFDWEMNVINITHKKPLSKTSKKWEHSFISIEDPFNPEKNIGASVVNIEIVRYIQSCFKCTFNYFLFPLEENESEYFDDEFSRIEIKPEFRYSFNAFSFTKMHEIPILCKMCDELGNTCKNCIKIEENQENQMKSLPKMTTGFLDIINKTLNDVYEENILNEKDIQIRKSIVNELKLYIRKIFPEIKLIPFGSSVNGFGLKKSDLDICLINENKITKQNNQQILKKLCYHLRKHKHIKDVIPLYVSKIPILKFTHLDSNIKCDISLDNTLAIYNSQLLETYSKIDERCKILGTAMKIMAKNACIGNSALRCLSSYSYILMVIHFLQQIEEPPILPILQELYNNIDKETAMEIKDGCNIWFFKDINNLKKFWDVPENKSTVGELWLRFLDYYVFLETDKVITIRQSAPLLVEQLSRSARLYNIQDPFLANKNLGTILSQKMALETQNAFKKARLLFGTPRNLNNMHKRCFKEYFFHPLYLTGKMIEPIECTLCGRMGHEKNDHFKQRNSKNYKSY